jgi:RAQPRD family integrative conjugative element protein
MKLFKYYKKTLAILALLAFAHQAFATIQMANLNLQRAMNELDAAKVYVEMAKQQEPKNTRVIFNYHRVISDVNQIEAGIRQKFLKAKIQPRIIKPIRNDYIGLVGKGG